MEANVTDRFTAAGGSLNEISFARETYRFNFSSTPADLVSEVRDYYGPTMNAFDAAEANGRTAALEQELVALFTAQNAAQAQGPPRSHDVPARHGRCLRSTLLSPSN